MPFTSMARRLFNTSIPACLQIIALKLQYTLHKVLILDSSNIELL